MSTRPVQISPRSLICSLTSVSVVDSWTPDLSRKQETKSNVSSLEDLGVQIGIDNLTPEELGEAKGLLNKWSDIFSTCVTDLGRTDTAKHEIKLTDNTPFKEPYRRIPLALYDKVCLHLKEMLEAGALRSLKAPIDQMLSFSGRKMKVLDFVSTSGS